MTTLRIRDIEDKAMREEYFRKNTDLLDENYPEWYEVMKEKGYSLKHRIVFSLLKNRQTGILNRIY